MKKMKCMRETEGGHFAKEWAGKVTEMTVELKLEKYK